MTNHRFVYLGLWGLLIAGSTTACGQNQSADTGAAPVESAGETTSSRPGTAPVIDPGDAGNYSPAIDPADFVDVIDNPYLPLAIGARWVYEGVDDEGGAETVEITVLDDTRIVMGVTTRVIRDRVTVNSELVEDTFDWFAQDRDGNVWYFGEDVKDYENGKLISTAGSWEAGKDGAQPGIVMPASPLVGNAYRQEFLAGEAEDMFEIKALDATVETPSGRYNDTMVTRDWSPLDAEVVEEKYYTPGIGKVAEFKVAGGSGQVLLVSYTVA